MRYINQSSAKAAATAALVIVLAALGLAACGGSSSSKSASTTSTAANAAANPARPGPAQFAKFRECLKQHGVTLPAPGGRSGSRGASPFGAGGSGLPKGVTRAQFETASKACGGARFRRAGSGSGRLRNPAFKAQLAKFAECMRKNGVNVPAPDTSGNGPIFSTKGINTRSSTFKAAQVKCSGELRSVFRPGARPGAGAAPPTGAGVPPDGAGAGVAGGPEPPPA